MLGVAPLDGDGGAVDGDALGLFERVEVGGGVAVVDVADLVLGAAEVEDALRRRGFAGVHVCDDADVTKFLEHGYTAAAFAAAPETRTDTGSDPLTRWAPAKTLRPAMNETTVKAWVPRASRRVNPGGTGGGERRVQSQSLIVPCMTRNCLGG